MMGMIFKDGRFCEWKVGMLGGESPLSPLPPLLPMEHCQRNHSPLSTLITTCHTLCTWEHITHVSCRYFLSPGTGISICPWPLFLLAILQSQPQWQLRLPTHNNTVCTYTFSEGGGDIHMWAVFMQRDILCNHTMRRGQPQPQYSLHHKTKLTTATAMPAGWHSVGTCREWVYV